MRVLLAEDNGALAEAMRYCLRKGGHEVEVASDGEEALAALEREAFGLLVLDLGLPKVDGIEVLRAARARRPGLPVLVSSAGEQTAERLAAHGLKADACLAKPFGIADFERVVAEVAWRHGLAEREAAALPLSEAERRLLALLSARGEAWMEADRIRHELAREQPALPPEEVQRCIDGLRDKLETGSPVRLVKVRGLGYGLMPAR